MPTISCNLIQPILQTGISCSHLLPVSAEPMYVSVLTPSVRLSLCKQFFIQFYNSNCCGIVGDFWSLCQSSSLVKRTLQLQACGVMHCLKEVVSFRVLVTNLINVRYATLQPRGLASYQISSMRPFDMNSQPNLQSNLN